MVVSYTVKILATMAELALHYILSYIIDYIIRPLEGQTDVDTKAVINRIVLWSVFMMFCAAVAVVGNITANRMAAKVSKPWQGRYAATFSSALWHSLPPRQIITPLLPLKAALPQIHIISTTL